MTVMYCAGDALWAAKTRERARRQIFSKENDRCGGRGRCRGSHAGTARGRERARTPAASVRIDDLKISWEESSRARQPGIFTGRLEVGATLIYGYFDPQTSLFDP